MLENAVTIHQNDYEKISDDILVLGNNAILRMNVTLARKTEDKMRRHFHSEFQYNTDKYIDKSSVITLRRSFDYFLTIENIKGQDRESIMLRPQDMYIFLSSLERCKQWFVSEQFKDLYVVKNNKLVILGKPEPVKIIGLAGNKTIIIAPTVLEYDGISYEGIRMFLNSEINSVDMTVDKFMGFDYLLNKIDMFGCAQSMVNYIGRPPMGENIITFSSIEPDADGYAEMKNRVIKQPKKQGSFFDKIDDLE